MENERFRDGLIYTGMEFNENFSKFINRKDIKKEELAGIIERSPRNECFPIAVSKLDMWMISKGYFEQDNIWIFGNTFMFKNIRRRELDVYQSKIKIAFEENKKNNQNLAVIRFFWNEKYKDYRVTVDTLVPSSNEVYFLDRSSRYGIKAEVREIDNKTQSKIEEVVDNRSDDFSVDCCKRRYMAKCYRNMIGTAWCNLYTFKKKNDYIYKIK